MTKLFLDISTTPDCSGMRIKDTSLYDNVSTVSDLILEIKAPGQDCFKFFNLLPGFDRSFTCIDLNLCLEGCLESETQLPDGNYEIKLSYAPNLYTMVEFNHFRNCQQFRKYIHENCRLFAKRYSMTQKDFQKSVDTLYRLKEGINSAKYAAEECLDITRGLDLYEDINHKLSLLDGQGCKDC